MSENETPIKYCVKCESVMLLKTNNTTGAQFYSCSNWPGCKFTQSVKAAKATTAILDDDAESPESRAANQIKDHAIEKCNAALEEIALRLKTIGPAIETMAIANAIPGFGKMADELTDEERAQRAEYFADRVKGSTLGKVLPYDTKEWITESPQTEVKNNG